MIDEFNPVEWIERRRDEYDHMIIQIYKPRRKRSTHLTKCYQHLISKSAFILIPSIITDSTLLVHHQAKWVFNLQSPVTPSFNLRNEQALSSCMHISKFWILLSFCALKANCYYLWYHKFKYRKRNPTANIYIIYLSLKILNISP
mgnify:CR=1 FL=1